MPTYDYECTKCGRITEEFKPMSAPRRQRCPHCRGKVERLISGGTGILFKGSGFYVNDSRGKKGKSTGGIVSDSHNESKPAAPSSTGNDTKKAGKDKG